jgi:hypothetical protein
LNTLPRKCLDFATPLAVYAHSCAIIHPLHVDLETAWFFNMALEAQIQAEERIDSPS